MEFVRMTAKEYRQQFTKNKYHAQKTEVGGITFDSKKESKVWEKLQEMARIGVITGLERQKRFELVPKQADERSVVYVADYVYFEVEAQRWVVADCKSAMTKKLPAYIIKRKLMKWRYPEYKFVEL